MWEILRTFVKTEGFAFLFSALGILALVDAPIFDLHNPVSNVFEHATQEEVKSGLVALVAIASLGLIESMVRINQTKPE